MSTRRRVLLINPTITSRRSARFPFAVLSLAASLEDHYAARIVDGNVDRQFVDNAVRMVAAGGIDAVGVSVMGGPQLSAAIAVSKAIRNRSPSTPILWGGYFPTLCPEASLNCGYVDYAIRGQGEDALRETLDAALAGNTDRLAAVDGLSWRESGTVVHNRNRAFSTAGLAKRLPYEQLGNLGQYLGRTCLGRRTTGYQAAIGCRFRCTFCGVASMFRGSTALPPVERIERELTFLRDSFAMDSVQFYDHNFFDREVVMIPFLEVLARLALPWWCYARSDALVNLSARSWGLVRKSRLRMAYIGAETPSDWLLHDVRKGTRSAQTLEAVEICHRHGVIPELSFMLAPPEDPEGETEKTFDFVRLVKRRYPETEVMLHVYTPLPPPWDPSESRVRRSTATLCDLQGRPVVFPATPDQWAAPGWIDYWCHKDNPWLSRRLRQRILDFTTVLGCRFPTVTDIRSPAWGKAALRRLAAWRYERERYERPWELNLSRKFIRLWDPRVEGL